MKRVRGGRGRGYQGSAGFFPTFYPLGAGERSLSDELALDGHGLADQLLIERRRVHSVEART